MVARLLIVSTLAAGMSRSGMAGLLAGDTTRSEHDPDLTLAPRHDSYASMHTVTGAFADPSLEVAFAAQLFRSACQGHLLLGKEWLSLGRRPAHPAGPCCAATHVGGETIAVRVFYER